MLTAQRNTAAEVFEGRAHAALRISRVRETTQRTRLRFRHAEPLRLREPLLVFDAARVDPAKREQDVAAQMVQTSKLSHHVVALRDLVGALQ